MLTVPHLFLGGDRLGKEINRRFVSTSVAGLFACENMKESHKIYAFVFFRIEQQITVVGQL